jgi:hypothetical protein
MIMDRRDFFTKLGIAGGLLVIGDGLVRFGSYIYSEINKSPLPIFRPVFHVSIYSDKQRTNNNLEGVAKEMIMNNGEYLAIAKVYIEENLTPKIDIFHDKDGSIAIGVTSEKFPIFTERMYGWDRVFKFVVQTDDKITTLKYQTNLLHDGDLLGEIIADANNSPFWFNDVPEGEILPTHYKLNYSNSTTYYVQGLEALTSGDKGKMEKIWRDNVVVRSPNIIVRNSNGETLHVPL